MIFDNPTESTYYNNYILYFPVGKDATGSIHLSKDAIEDILSDLLVLKDGESIYIKRNGDSYACGIEGQTGYGFCVSSIGEALGKLIKSNH